jgi:putative endonuclease
MGGYFYIMASQRNGTLYSGMTNGIARRVVEHRAGKGSRFAKRYGVHILVYYEAYERIEDAIAREKQVKEWKRAWKLELIEGMNPEWRDLYEDVVKL